jgi:ribosomal protein S6--L-glutamate ligase
MKIGLLSLNGRSYTARRLRQAAKDRGHDIRVMRTDRFSISVETAQPDLYYMGRHITSLDAVIPRIGISITHFGTAVVRQLEQLDIFCLNSSLGIANARDKLRGLQILARHNIGIPPTTFVRGKSDILPAIRRVGGAPVIIKLLEGTQGAGVVLAESEDIANAIVQALHSASQNVLVQQFVAESRGRDVRALVVGDKVVAAMRRRATGNEFRSNVHLGATTEAVTLDAEWERTAVQAAQIIGLRVAGVDLLESDDGPRVIEVNSSPGLEGIEGATGADVAGAIIDHIEQNLLFPEMDIRQRLTVSSGYGVCELPLPKGSALIGLTIEGTGLRELDIVVLSLYREGHVIPNPRSSRELHLGDRLLCYGKLETMRSMLPPRPKRRRKGKSAAAGRPGSSSTTESAAKLG